MFTKLVWICVLVSPLSAAVVKDAVSYCGPTEFACGDGGCVSAELVCDGARDCADGGDEDHCGAGGATLSNLNEVLHRWKRQTSACRSNQFACRGGSCISFDGKCDGVVDCPDGSDETHALCRKNVCQHNWFRCTYGACVDGTAPCNGVQECADNSDELLPRCRNETSEIRGQFTCLNGDKIPASSHCDGARDCRDGSDETVRSCAGKTCQNYLFQCAYGACVDSGADCNQVQECADGSDESSDLCDKNGNAITPTKPPKGDCILPPYPEQGTYVSNIPNGRPGEAYSFITLNITCRTGYAVDGLTTPSSTFSVSCHDAYWPLKMPNKCVPLCHLPPHPSVEYRCLVNRDGVEGIRTCSEFEPHGSVVSPRCRTPNYYSPDGGLSWMHCIDGVWDNIAICKPECGTVVPGGQQLVVNGTNSKQGDVPWHAGIYTKTKKPPMQICGGTIISTNTVISAAHCFWADGEPQPPSKYAVAVGKIYRPWNDPSELERAQRSDVKSIHLPVRYQDSRANFQEDIAVVVVSVAFEFRTYVRPVCLDFDVNFERLQLNDKNTGKVAGWGLTGKGNPAPILQVIDLPYVEVDTCIANSPANFREYITSDKICAGVQDGTKALCQGDSGGGLAFPALVKGVTRYYLRGIVSTSPNDDDICNANAYTSFTLVSRHETFIKQWSTGSL